MARGVVASAAAANGSWCYDSAVVFVLHLFTMLSMFVLMTIYVVHAFKTDLIPNDRRVLWVVVLLFGGIIACPIYWYLFMWRPGKQAA